jgi:hypothetical protein
VFGRLDHFLPDGYLETLDVFTDDTKAINGCFTLFRNNEKCNNLFKEIPNWKEAFTASPCPKCTTGEGEHTLTGTDEYGMTKAMLSSGLVYKRPLYFPLHGHDRLQNHEIELEEDGTLYELNRDLEPPSWENAIPVFGREILFFHFQKTKRWPL